MRLCKRVCMACRKAFVDKVDHQGYVISGGWNEESETRWNRRLVDCPHWGHTIWVDRDELPEPCPYKMEHMINQNGRCYRSKDNQND